MTKTPEGQPLQSTLWLPEQLPPTTPQFETVLETEGNHNLDGMMLITGNSNPELAKEIGRILSLSVQEPISLFKDGESNVKISRNLRKREIFIIQSTSRPQNQHIVDLALMIDAAKRASAGDITAVIPYYGYARQDRKAEGRVPISAKVISDMLTTAGAKRILTMDIHAEQEQGFTDIWDNIYASPVLLPAIQNLNLDNPVMVSPDAGGAKRARNFSRLLDLEDNIAIVDKKRAHANQSEALSIIGEVKGRNAVIVDDMIDTAGTLTNAAKMLMEEGALSVDAIATHGLFSEDAINKINLSPINNIIVTDTIKLSDEITSNPKIKVVSVAGLLAETIKRIHLGLSVSEIIPTTRRSS